MQSCEHFTDREMLFSQMTPSSPKVCTMVRVERPCVYLHGKHKNLLACERKMWPSSRQAAFE